METDPVDSFIFNKVKNQHALATLTPKAFSWLKDNLSSVPTNKETRLRIQNLLGNAYFTSNLAHMGEWKALQQMCEAEALSVSKPMQAYFLASNLGVVLGEALPNVHGRLKHDSGLGKVRGFVVDPCRFDEGIRRQDSTIVPPIQDISKSQLYNEKTYIHVLRMVSMALDADFQAIISSVCEGCGGEFTGCRIKGYTRILNKTKSKNDHFHEEFPRYRRRALPT
jgi:hypothetical protein